MECKSKVRFVMGVLDNLDCDLLSALEDLIEDGELEQGSKEHGVALQVALRGYGSLSLQQQYLFNTRSFRWSRNTTRNDIGMSARSVRQPSVRSDIFETDHTRIFLWVR